MIAIISDPSTNKYRQMRLRLAGAARARWRQRGSAGCGRYKDEKTKEERKHKEVMTQQKELQRVQEEDLARKSKLLDEVHALQERNKNLRQQVQLQSALACCFFVRLIVFAQSKELSVSRGWSLFNLVSQEALSLHRLYYEVDRIGEFLRAESSKLSDAVTAANNAKDA